MYSHFLKIKRIISNSIGILLIGSVILSCTDRLEVVTFEVDNRYDELIVVKFRNYYVFEMGLKMDTAFTIQSGQSEIVYFGEGLVLNKERLVKGDSLSFCDSVEVSCENCVTRKNFISIAEWAYKRADDHTETYTLIVDSDDF